MADYFVRNGGNDGNDGLSDANAWATLNKVETSSFVAGDTISLKRGSVWRESLAFPSSGTNGNPIIVKDYDAGSKPLVMGSEDLGPLTWTNAGSNRWYATPADFTVSSSLPHQIIFNTGGVLTWGQQKGSQAAIVDADDWWPDTGNNRVYVFSTSDPSSAFVAVEATYINELFLSNVKNYITLRGIEFKFALSTSLDGMVTFRQTTGGIIEDVEASYGGDPEREPSGGGGNVAVDNTSTDCIWRRCKFSEGGRHVWFMWGAGSGSRGNSTVTECELFNGYHTCGVDAQVRDTSSGGITTITYNRIYTNAIYNR